MKSPIQVLVQVVNAFVEGGVPHGGNPAGVVLNAERYSPEQKQEVAARIGLSETAFVSPSQAAAFKLEFFTPNRQIAHCGHATVATYSYLHQLGQVGSGRTSKETIDGTREILIEDGMAFMEQRPPVYTELSQDDVEAVLDSLNVRAQDLMPGRAPLIVNTGNSFLLVPLKDAAAVRAVQPRQERIAAISERHDLIGYYLFSLDPEMPGSHAGTRMFAPRYGIAEEAATGMAAGPLASLLHDRFDRKIGTTFAIEQGRWMPQSSPSLIEVRLELQEGRIQKLMAGGRARHVETREVLL